MADRSDYHLHPDVEWILRPDGSSRLMHMNAKICALDAASTQLLQWLIEIGPERAAAKLVARYEVDEVQAQQDLNAYIAELRKHKFICPLLSGDRALEHVRKVAARAFVPAALYVVDLVARNCRLGVWGFLWAAKWTVAQFGWGTALSEWQKMYPQPVRETLANTERWRRHRWWKFEGGVIFLNLQRKPRRLASPEEITP